MNALAHVLDVDVPQRVLPGAHVVRDRHFALAVQVADVQRQAKRRVAHAVVQLGKDCGRPVVQGTVWAHMVVVLAPL